MARLMAAPARALATLVDGVPAAVGADWAAALGQAVVAPLGDSPLALLVVREDGPAFHRS